MFSYDDIKVVQLEGTSACNAACPMCIRYDSDGYRQPFLGSSNTLRQRTTTATFWQKHLTAGLLKQLRLINFCGNYGDPSLMLDVAGLIRYLRASAPACQIVMETNGGGMHGAFWYALAHAMKGPHEVVFNIDGLSDTLATYRRNVSYEKVREHALSFIRGGGNATWSFLVFRHNEHQVEEARKLAADLGFAKFQVRLTDRFYGNDGTVYQDIKGLKPPLNATYRYERQINGSEFVKQARSCEANCMSKRDKRVYVDYLGRVFPCCFLAPVEGELSQLGTTEVARLLEALGRGVNSLHEHSLREIVEGPFFQTLDQLLTSPDRPLACGAVCGMSNFKITK